MFKHIQKYTRHLFQRCIQHIFIYIFNLKHTNKTLFIAAVRKKKQIINALRVSYLPRRSGSFLIFFRIEYILLYTLYIFWKSEFKPTAQNPATVRDLTRILYPQNSVRANHLKGTYIEHNTTARIPAIMIIIILFFLCDSSKIFVCAMVNPKNFHVLICQF